MSYGSTFVPFEPHGKISARHTRVRRELPERPTRLVQYEKEFDVNLSRLDGPVPTKSSVRESMLAYSKKMRSLQDARNSSSSVTGSSGDKLFVRAKHIPKYPTREPKKRRPMSFDELLGRDRESSDARPNAGKQRPKSDKIKPVKDSEKKSETELRLPLLTERLKKSGPIHVSLVSASDLYDIVDFSLKTKGTKSDSLKLLNMERETNSDFSRGNRHAKGEYSAFNNEKVSDRDLYDKFERTTDNYQQDYLRRDRYPFFNEPSATSIPDSDFYEQTFAIDTTPDFSTRQERNMNSNIKLPSLNPNDPIRRRPNRAKRMRLVDPMLGDIPEDTILTTGSNYHEIDFYSRRVISPPPKFSTNQSDIARHTLSSIEVSAEIGQSNRSDNLSEFSDQHSCLPNTDLIHNPSTYIDGDQHGRYRSIFPVAEDAKSTKKILIRDDGDVRIEVTQCPPKPTQMNTKQKAQKRFKKLIYLRDGAR